STGECKFRPRAPRGAVEGLGAGRLRRGGIRRRQQGAGRGLFRAGEIGRRPAGRSAVNPELERNLWLEASPFRLALILGLLLLVFSATSIAPRGLMTTPGTALALYWFFAVLWGTRSAALSVVAEIRERTWDGQQLSAIGPWEMVWGKLFGSTAAN